MPVVKIKSNGLVDLPAGSTIGGSTITALGTIASASANALTAGRLGATTPAFNVDASTAVSVTGLNVKAASTGNPTAVLAIGETNTGLNIDTAGTGALGLNTLHTGSGLVTIGNTTSLAGAFVNGPLWGSRKVLASSGNTTLTAAMSGACMLFDVNSGVTFTLPVPVVGMEFDFLVSVSATSNGHKVITNSGSVFLAGNALIAVDNTASKTWVGDGATHVSLNQTAAGTNAKGGLIGSWARFIATTSTMWTVSALLVGGGTSSTPFATS